MSRSWPKALSAALTIPLLSLAACGSGEDEDKESTAGEPLEKVSFQLNFLPSGLQAPYYMAEEMGYFEEEGIEIDLRLGKGSQLAVNDIASKNADIGVTGTTNVFIGAASGQEVVAVATPLAQNSFGFFVSEESGVKDIAGLEGKSLVVASATPQAVLAPALLKMNDVDPTSVKTISVAPESLLSSYAGGSGDAMATAMPYGSPLVQPKRPSEELYWRDHGLTIPDFSLFVHKDTLASDPEMIQKVVRASLRGFIAAAEDPDRAIEAIAGVAPTLNKDDAKAEWLGYLSGACADDMEGEAFGKQSEADWQAGLDTLNEHADLDGGTDATTFYTNEFFEGDDAIDVALCPLSF